MTYQYGVAPPPPALEAAKQLASNVMLAMNAQACQLPANIRSAVRQGATFERITPLAQELKAGRPGCSSGTPRWPPITPTVSGGRRRSTAPIRPTRYGRVTSERRRLHRHVPLRPRR